MSNGISQTVEKIKQVYVKGSNPSHKKSDKSYRESMLPDLIRQDAIAFIKSHQTPEAGLRNLSSWKNGIKFALMQFDPVMYRDVNVWLEKGTRLIANDL